MGLFFRFFVPIIIFVLMVFSSSGKAKSELSKPETSVTPNYYQADPEEKAGSRDLTKKQELNERRKIMLNMSTETKKLVEFEKKAHVRAFRKTFDSLSPEEKQLYKEIRVKIKDNAQAQKKFFESLNQAEKNFLRSPRKRVDPSFVAPDGVRMDNVKKFEEYENELARLTNRMPKRIRDIELSDEDKLKIHEMRKAVEKAYVKSGSSVYSEALGEDNTRADAMRFTGIRRAGADRMR